MIVDRERRSMTKHDARRLWATLAATGTAPTDLVSARSTLPTYSVATGPWLDRLAKRYLTDLCLDSPHFKLVVAHYGGGKTHFLMELGDRAIDENYAVAYVPCASGVSLAKPLELFKETVKRIIFPGDDECNGIHGLLDRAIEAKRADIRRAGAPDEEIALDRWISTVRKKQYAESAFGRVIGTALRSANREGDDATADAAARWLQGDIDTLSRAELTELRLARMPRSDLERFGRDMFLSLTNFLPESGVNGLVLLLDEVETLFAERGKALRRVLSAMRVLIDIAGPQARLPLFGVFSAVPDILPQIDNYPALKQRISVRGATFDEGNDFAMQLPLDKMEGQESLLASIGRKLIEVGALATGYDFDSDVQTSNAAALARVAVQRTLEIDSRRLYIKTWVGLLELQSKNGERKLSPSELEDGYRGSIKSIDEDDGDYEA